MKWRKLGRLYSGQNKHPKLFSHASNPLAIHLKRDIFRIFYSGRDQLNRSSMSYVDVDIVLREIVYEHDVPVFQNGPPSSFFSEGVSIGCYYSIEQIQYILFMGWKNDKTNHWYGQIGRLVLSEDMNSVKLDPEVSFLDLDATDPLSLSYPWVLKTEKKYFMWYGSTLNWDLGNGEMLHVINKATSDNGHIWNREGLALPYKKNIAQAFSRPCIIKDDLGYHAWFSFRSGREGETNRIGYAQSIDGDQWRIQLTSTGIDVSMTGWDSEMIEYPYVFDHNGKRYMLYNGNGYGKTGFGLAVLEY